MNHLFASLICIFIYFFFALLTLFYILLHIILFFTLSLIALLGYGTVNSIFLNIYDGWRSLFYTIAVDDDDQHFGNYPSSIGIILMYILSNAFVIYFMNNVLELSRGMIGRSIEIAIIIAFILLWLYDMMSDNYDHNYNSRWLNYHHSIIDIIAIIILITGMDIYDKGKNSINS